MVRRPRSLLLRSARSLTTSRELRPRPGSLGARRGGRCRRRARRRRLPLAHRPHDAALLRPRRTTPTPAAPPTPTSSGSAPTSSSSRRSSRAWSTDRSSTSSPARRAGTACPEVMDAVANRGGRIKPQVAAVKALASALTIGGGGSVGREGPIVQIGAALGSTFGRLARRRTRARCGCSSRAARPAASPRRSTPRSPGVFFAMELILIDFSSRHFGMVVLAVGHRERDRPRR